MNARSVLLVQLASDLSGSPMSGLDVARCLKRHGHEVVVALGSEGPVMQRYAEVGCKVLVLPHRNWLRRAGLLRFLKDSVAEVARTQAFLALLRCERVDLVYVNSTVSLAPVLAGRLARIPVVWHLRELFSDVGGELQVPRLLHAGVRWLVSTLPRQLVANSHATAANVLGKRAVRAAVLPNTLSDVFVRGAPSRTAARKAFGVSPDAWVLGLPGTLRPTKGQLFVLESCGNWLREHTEALVLVTGDPSTAYGRLLQQRVAESGLTERFRFVDVVDDMAAFLRTCDVACVPSKAESFGRVALEAFAVGVPLVASGYGGIQDIVRDGHNGLLVTHGDEEALLGAIRSLYEDRALAERLADTARQDFVTCYSESRFCAHLYDILAPYLEQSPTTGGA